MDKDLFFERTGKAAVRFLAFWLLVFGLIPVQLVACTWPGPNPYRVQNFMYRAVLWILGFHVRVFGQRHDAKSMLYVSNHASYLDVPVLGAVTPALFVAKADVAGWPIFGFLTTLYRTVFVERRAVRAATQKDQIRDKLEEGWRLILFPEGTSTDGLRILPFKSSLFAIAEKPLSSGEQIQIQPVSVNFAAISGLPAGRTWRPYYAWIGDMTLLKHLWTVFSLGHFTVDVIFHPPVTLAAIGDRKALAAYCHRAVSYGVETALAGHPEVFAADGVAKAA